jgi:hypothetical protein
MPAILPCRFNQNDNASTPVLDLPQSSQLLWVLYGPPLQASVTSSPPAQSEHIRAMPV